MHRSTFSLKPCLVAGLFGAATLPGCAYLTPPPTPAPAAVPPASDNSRIPEQLHPDLYPKGAQPQPEPVVRYGRYTLVSTQPTAEQRDLLSQIIDVSIPDVLNPRVEDAMAYVLRRSGYQLCPGQGNIRVLYSRSLPASQYQLGPMTLRNTLQVLAGPAWQVQVDEVTRSVCFTARAGYQRPVMISAPSPSLTAPAGTPSATPYPAPASPSVQPHQGNP